MRWTLTRKLTVLIGCVFAFVAAFVWLMQMQMVRISLAREEVQDEWEELTHVMELTYDLHELGRLIEHPERMLPAERNETIALRFQSFNTRMGRLKSLQSRQRGAIEEDQAGEWAVIQQVGRSVREIETQWNTLMQSDGPHEVHANAAILDLLHRSVRDLQGFGAYASDELQASIAAMRAAHHDVTRFFTILLFSSASFLALLGLAFFLSIIRPIRRLTSMVERFHRRELSGFPKSRSKDEMGELTNAFSEMAREIQTFTENLEGQIESRTHELLHSQKLAGIGRLAAGVAHEINNPLASIRICAEGLLKRMEEGGESLDDETFREYLQTVRDEADRTKGIVEKLLDFSRSKEPDRREIDVAELARDTLRLVHHLASRNECSMTVDIAEDETLLVCDSDQIKQVLLNLLLNAIDACAAGGDVRFALKPRKDCVVFEVSDTGCGIASEDLSQVFEPFFSKKADREGAGLGLAVCHGIVQSHQGDIRAESPGPGKGARFTVRLPRELAPSRASI